LAPARVVLVHGTPQEYEKLAGELVTLGTIEPLNEKLRPHSFSARSDPRDVARLESRTVICSERERDAGPTNNWRDPVEMRSVMGDLYRGAMRGRTLYVIPFSMGPVDSEFAIYGVELTDSAYVVISMMKMARVGDDVLRGIEERGTFVPAVHSVGMPLEPGEVDVPWPCNPENTWIAHFPETREIWSFGSGYGGNALLGKKCLALRIASVMARDEGWLAEHMLIVKLTSPRGEVHYVAGAFPSACGKTNLAMIAPRLQGWTAETLGDDIAWIRPGPDGRLYALNPELGFFGVAPGTSEVTNKNAMLTMSHDTIFTNCAVTGDGDVWWEGMTEEPPVMMTDWQGKSYDRASGKPAAHPNARFTVSVTQAPHLAPEWDDPRGVPLSAILFGGRRTHTIPLVTEARDFVDGVLLGSIMGSETTAAAEGEVGRPRRDPFAMLPFCGYHMADYFAHWLKIGETKPDMMPRIYLVNWFRKNEQGSFVWPGYAENLRVLAWIVDRLAGRAQGEETPLGIVPAKGELDCDGLDLDVGELAAICTVDPNELSVELRDVHEHYARFGDVLPELLADRLRLMERRLADGK
jgi:phosphoenolpyruvate carboxykinase (GTP)